MKFIMVLAFLSLGALVASKSYQNTKELVWFPNPKNDDGSMIPAKLTPTPGAKEGNASDVHFYLFNKKNGNASVEIKIGESLADSNFIAGAPVKLLIHGFGGSYNDGFPRNLKLEYLKMEKDLNLILVDWEILAASPDYFTAVANAQICSAQGAALIDFLVKDQYVKLEDVHLVGFSLGGQVVGQIGSRVTVGLLPRITALDPALPLFDVAHIDNRTDPTDAVFVDVIHTAGNGILGYWDPLGHADFYPNGGRYQPGCGVDLTGSCAHGRAPAMMEESVFTTTRFHARACDTYENWKNGTCDGNPTALMGEFTPSSTRGLFFLDSNAESPFALGPL